jgi:2-oxoglutarate dehydrogenase E2 component (dihydrolipoamide succinyltransferase)
MTIEVKVPALPESVSDGVVVGWHKQPGEPIRRDEALVDIETDKVVLEVPAPDDGVLESILMNDGDTVTADQVIGIISEGEMRAPQAQPVAAAAPASPANESPRQNIAMGPAARKLVAEHQVDPGQISGSGKDGRITKADVVDFVNRQAAKPAAAPEPVSAEPRLTPGLPEFDEDRPQKRVPMSRLRARIAERLLQATQTTAMLTTFNEVNMQPVMELRAKHKEAFEKSHSAEALKRHPDINASIDGDDIVYHGYCDIGIAIGTERGLVVPILRNAEYMTLAEIETYIVEFSEKARTAKLEMEDITGGTFTISNGGVFGSMLSTPILNPPQSAILGMHKIQERPVVPGADL